LDPELACSASILRFKKVIDCTSLNLILFSGSNAAALQLKLSACLSEIWNLQDSI
jgi:hypothetical protein